MKQLICITITLCSILSMSCNNESDKNTTSISASADQIGTSETKPSEQKEVQDSTFASIQEIAIYAKQKGMQILDTAVGDLNMDNIPDYIVVLQDSLENNDVDIDENDRIAMIVLKDKNNRLTIARQNDKTVLCKNCGGAMGDPYVGITIKNSYFTFEHYGGSSWRWSKYITYKYDNNKNEWFLHKIGSESFHASEPDKVTTETLTTKDFGTVKFEDYDINTED